MTTNIFRLGLVIACSLQALCCWAAEPAAIKELLSREIIGPDLALAEVEDYCEALVPLVPRAESTEAWEKLASQWRKDMFDKVVFRGEAALWRRAPRGVEWLETIEGGAGYRIKKLRYEVLPGLWAPALLYEPEGLKSEAPVVLNVNGHDRPKGKAADYKQIRCINQAKRGMIALNLEWLGMGQLNTGGFDHYRMNQLDLCGTSGLAPFYLAMERGLDILLEHKFADPRRVGVAGLSGGGWQTIFISSLDTRVTLSNPVAGYSSFRTRVRNHSDLGDSEQTPCDMATVADYAHLTAMMAPRATLLTFNVKDQCCFASGHALQPLLDVSVPVFELYGKPQQLRSHVNHDPGTHNFEQDNRQALYRMIAASFYAGADSFDAQEIECEDELKTKQQLEVALPDDNADFQKLAIKLSANLPHNGDLPDQPSAGWTKSGRQRLAEIVRAKEYQVTAEKVSTESNRGLTVTSWRLHMNDAWTVPAMEFSRGESNRATIVVADSGRQATAATVERLLDEGGRVFAVDPFYIGESKIKSRDFLFALLVSAVGDRPLGLQAGQLAAISHWLKDQRQQSAVAIVAEGERTSLAALVAANLAPEGIDRVELAGSLGSLKQVIELNYAVNQKPEFFCFGLLKEFDYKNLVALAAPREIRFVNPSDRVKAELADLKAWYALHDAEFDPLH